MATTILAGDVWEAKFYCGLLGQVGINVTHFRCTSSTGTGATDAAFATQLDNAAAPAYKAAIATPATYYGVSVQRVAPLPKTLRTVSQANTGVGSGGPAALPSQVSGIITIQTTVAGRANRGRAYIPFPPSALNDNTLDVPTAAYVTALTAVAQAITGAYTVGSGANIVQMTPTIFHRKNGLDTLVAATRSNKKWATQRRRGNYGAANPLPPV